MIYMKRRQAKFGHFTRLYRRHGGWAKLIFAKESVDNAMIGRSLCKTRSLSQLRLRLSNLMRMDNVAFLAWR